MKFQKSIRYFTFLLLLSGTTFAIAASSAWEYHVKTYPIMGNDQALTQVFNELGERHWELVNCTEGDAELICIFKRPIEEGAL